MTTATKGAVYAIEVFGGSGDANGDELLRLAASLDQASRHDFAPALIHAAHERGLALSAPCDVIEEAAYGIRGLVNERAVALGTSYWVDRTSASLDHVRRIQEQAARSGCANIFVAIDGVLAGAILIVSDPGSAAGDGWPGRPWGFYA